MNYYITVVSNFQRSILRHFRYCRRTIIFYWLEWFNFSLLYGSATKYSSFNKTCCVSMLIKQLLFENILQSAILASRKMQIVQSLFAIKGDLRWSISAFMSSTVELSVHRTFFLHSNVIDFISLFDFHTRRHSLRICDYSLGTYFMLHYVLSDLSYSGEDCLLSLYKLFSWTFIRFQRKSFRFVFSHCISEFQHSELMYHF